MPIKSIYTQLSGLAGRAFTLALAFAATLQGATLLKQNFDSSNPWSAMTGYTTGAGTVTATPSYGAFGTINVINTGTSSNGLQLTVNSSAASGAWTAGVTSGVLTLLTTTTQGREFITLAFSLSASSAYPVRVKIESFDNSSVRTGGLAKLIYPASADFYQRFAIDLDTMSADGAGSFNPAAPRVQITFELDSTVNSGISWPAAAHSLLIDNINLATPRYYVSPTGSNSNNGLTPSAPFATVQRAADLLRSASAGINSDNIIAIMGGADYIGTNSNGAMVQVTKTGTPDDWIVFKNYPGHTPVLRPNGWEGFKLTNNNDGGVSNAASYVEIRGLTIRGLSSFDANGDRQIDPAYQSTVGLKQGPSNGNGISVDGRNNALIPRHFHFADNTVEYMPGAGINVLDADRVAVENNLSRYNCWWMVYAGSGINFFEILDTETGSTYRMLIRDNVVYGNEAMVPWFPSSGQFSDGNGLILDTYSLTYTGKTLVANNLVFNNGGSGVHILQASNVDAVHNTSYMNSASPNLAYTQLDTQSTCVNIRMTNNIGVAPRNATGVTSGSTAYLFNEPVTAVSTFNSSNIVHLRNLYAGGDITPVAAALGANNTDLGRAYNAANLFISPSTDPAVADFRLRAGVVALNYGAVVGYRGSRDLAGTPRSLTGPTDVGTYQLVANLAYSPVVSVPSGNYFGTTQNVALTSDTAAAALVYTTNGTTPTVNASGTPTNGTLYTAPIPVSSATTLKAIAWKSGLTTSPVTTALYTFTDLSTTPVALEIWTRAADGNGQELTDLNSAGLTSSTIHPGRRPIQGLTRTPGAHVRYTTDGVSTPTATTGTPQEYRGYFVEDYALLRYRAFKSGRADSPILSAAVTIRASVGNTADGTTLVTTGANTIRYVRFQAAEAFSAANIFARLNGVTGNYRAAIYSDSSSIPGAKLAESSLITNPASGWIAFPLTSRTTLSKNAYYWLALWSDNASAGIFSTPTGGTVRQQTSTFSSTWPSSPSSTALSATNNYAIYATNAPPNLAPVVAGGADQSIALSSSATLVGTVSDDGVPLAPGAATSVWTQVSGPGTATFATSTSPATTATFSTAGTYVLRLTARDALLTSSDDVTVTVTSASAVATTLTAGPSPADPGATVTLTATVSSGGGTPTGTVTFFDGATNLGTATLNGSGIATLVTTALPSGLRSLTATYGATANFLSSTSAPLAQTIRSTTATALTSSLNPADLGTAITLTATVSSAGGTPTGTVTFFDGVSSLGTGTLNGSGIATLVTSTLPAGTRSLTAAFATSAAFAASTSPVLSQVIRPANTTTLSSSLNPANLGAPVTFTATITAASGTPTGTVTFLDGVSSLGTGTLNGSGVATFTTSSLPAGSRSITANYSGDASNQPSTSAILSQVILASDVTPPGVVRARFTDGAGSLYPQQYPGTAGDGWAGGWTLASPGTAAIAATTPLSPGAGNYLAVSRTSGTGAGSQAGVYRQWSETTLPRNQFSRLIFQFRIDSTSSFDNSGDAYSLFVSNTATMTPGTSTTVYIRAFGASPGVDANGVIIQAREWCVFNGTPGTADGYAVNRFRATGLVAVPGVTYTFTIDTYAADAAGTTSGKTHGTYDVTVTDGTTTKTILGSGFRTADYTSGAYLAFGTQQNLSTDNLAYSVDSIEITSLSLAAPTTSTLASSANPADLGAPVTLTATVTSGSGTPAGTVTFLDGATSLGSATLNASGIATLTTSALPAGTRSLAAAYSATATFAASTSPALAQTIRYATSTTLSSSLNSANPGDAVTFTATVSASGATPTGSVSFYDDAVLLGTSALNGSGAATLTTSALPVGSHSITALYVTTPSFTSSAATPLVQVIRQPTGITLASDFKPSNPGQSITLTATLEAGGAFPGGSVSFFDDAVLLGTSALNGSGVATLTTSTLPPGDHNLTAIYPGSSTFTASDSAPLFQRIRAVTDTTLASSLNPADSGSAVTFTATVASGAGTPDGTVTFFDGATNLGTAILDASGVATFTTSTLPSGVRSITATYSATSTYAASTSPALSQTINALSPYATWRAVYFSPTDLANPAKESTVWGSLADPDGDGLVNLLEYALELVPTTANALPAGMQPASVPLTLSFKRARAELTYTVEGSSDLATWTSIGTNPGTVGTTVTVTDQPPVPTPPARFLRLRVTL